MPAFDSDREKFAALDAQVLDISTDSVISHIAWQKKELGMMHLPMCSDFYPHGEVARSYGVLREEGFPERALFLIDKQGVIRYVHVHEVPQQPDNRVVLEVLRKLG